MQGPSFLQDDVYRQSFGPGKLDPPQTSTLSVGPEPIVINGQAGASPTGIPYTAPATEPTQLGPLGLRYDFNHGLRLMVPDVGRRWRVRLSDLDAGNILYETELTNGIVRSAKRYYIRGRFEVWVDGESVFTHEYSARNREILVQLPAGTLGDVMGWFPYIPRFQKLHGCRMTCVLMERMIPVFKDAYPEIEFVTSEQVDPARYYATYNIGLFFDDHLNHDQPCDFRLVGLHRTAGYILGVDPTEEPPLLGVPDEGRPIEEPYVCIAVQSTTHCKTWTNPFGWRDLIEFLKAAGYRVVCIDQKPVNGFGIIWTHLPHGVEDQTGDRPLAERIWWLRHAEFFVGLSSGLSWLAWATRIPVVMISGFTHPINEFATPYRVINYNSCNSCWNDSKVRFDHHDYLFCPRHKNTPRQFECTGLITADAVKAAISRIDSFRARQEAIQS